MNKKLVFGLSTFCAVGTFVACGDGSIVSTDSSDKLAKASAQTDLTELDTTDIRNLMIASGISVSENTFASAAETPVSSAAAPVASSASTTPVSSESSTLSSPSGFSAAGGEVGVVSSSSESTTVPVATSSSTGESGTIAGADAGSCAPTTASISRGGSTTWTYTPPSTVTGVSALMKLTSTSFTWSFTDGTPDTETKAGTTSSAVTYTTSGSKAASVTFDYRTGVSETVACTPVEVQGYPVTGCTCTPTSATPDLAGGASVDASWSVAGCTSEDPTFTYTWGGVAGTDTYSTSLTTKGETAAPTVVVKNSDNGSMTVTCGAVKAIDSSSPDYVLDGTDDGTYTVGAGTYTMVYACNASQYYQPPLVVAAADANGVSGSWSAGTNTGTISAGAYGQSLINYSDLFGAWSESSDKTVTITVDGSATVKCQ